MSVSEAVSSKLGDAAWQRLYDFSRWPDGWTGPHSRSIAWGTYQNFERFLHHARFPTQRPPSLFLTNEGHLELTWESRDGSAINVTLSPEGAAYFLESEGEEGSAPPDQLALFAERCNRATC